MRRAGCRELTLTAIAVRATCGTGWAAVGGHDGLAFGSGWLHDEPGG